MSATPDPVSAPPALTARSLIAGFVLAVALCGINSYLTLSFGVIEEGPTIAALFFFAFFFLARTKITTTEMVMVATMGSAGHGAPFSL
ncbi:MAG: OPT/YSL family transporter [Sandaracinaceae bacterium]|nr:OPT/YSL family transporter [Sandaracinaceae bacterium]